MRKRILSLLLCCVMLIGLLPTAAFAEDSAESPPVCSCETACTAESMNKECPVCGAENAIPQNCGQYIPVEDRTGENGSTERADDPNGPTELSAADQVQAMIDGLPNAEEITEDNAEEVKAQLEAIDEAKEKLSDEEIDELDMTRYAEAAAALGALAAPMLLANDSPDEQFSLAPGGRYYFDLSGDGHSRHSKQRKLRWCGFFAGYVAALCSLYLRRNGGRLQAHVSNGNHRGACRAEQI